MSPSHSPSIVKAIAVRANENATGYPITISAMKIANMMIASHSLFTG